MPNPRSKSTATKRTPSTTPSATRCSPRSRMPGSAPTGETAGGTSRRSGTAGRTGASATRSAPGAGTCVTCVATPMRRSASIRTRGWTRASRRGRVRWSARGGRASTDEELIRDVTGRRRPLPRPEATAYLDPIMAEGRTVVTIGPEHWPTWDYKRMRSMPLEPQRSLGDLRALRSSPRTGREPSGSPGPRRGRRRASGSAGLLAELPVTVEVDEAGNHWATLEGDSPRDPDHRQPLDSVPDGGWLDGSPGRAVRGSRSCAASPPLGGPPVTVKLVGLGRRGGRALRAEPGRPPAAVAGTLSRGRARARDAEGQRGGGDGRAWGSSSTRCWRLRAGWGGHRWLHIGRGRCLEPEPAAAGSSPHLGTERWAVRFTARPRTPARPRWTSVATHFRGGEAGAEVRELAARVAAWARSGGSTREPGIPTAVAGVATVLVDQRQEEGDVLAEVRAEAERPAVDRRRGGRRCRRGRRSSGSRRFRSIPA